MDLLTEARHRELRDRFGRLPEPARSLLRLKELRLLAEEGGIEQLQVKGAEASFRFAAGREPSRETVQALVRAVPAQLSFQADGREGLRIRLRADEGLLDAAEALLRACGASDTVMDSHPVR